MQWRLYLYRAGIRPKLPNRIGIEGGRKDSNAQMGKFFAPGQKVSEYPVGLELPFMKFVEKDRRVVAKGSGICEQLS